MRGNETPDFPGRKDEDNGAASRNEQAGSRILEIEEGLNNYDQEMYREILTRLGEDPKRDGLVRTPERVEKSMAFLTKGYSEDPAKILRGALCTTTGEKILDLVKAGIRPRHIVTREALENAATVVSATGGPTNAALQSPAVAHECG